MTKILNLARSIAVNMAIKSGTRLNEIEMQEIFDKLFMCKVPKVSPDGQKTLTILGVADLENLVKSNN